MRQLRSGREIVLFKAGRLVSRAFAGADILDQASAGMDKGFRNACHAAKFDTHHAAYCKGLTLQIHMGSSGKCYQIVHNDLFIALFLERETLPSLLYIHPWMDGSRR